MSARFGSRLAALTVVVGYCCLALGPASAALWYQQVVIEDPNDPGCRLQLEVGTPVTADIVYVSSYNTAPLRQMVLRIQGMPPSGADGTVTYDWGLVPTSGDVTSGLTFVFDPPLAPSSTVQLGTVQLEAHSPSWAGSDQEVAVSVLEGLDVLDQSFPAWETKVTLNCSYPTCCYVGQLHLSGPTIWFGPTTPGPEAQVSGVFDLEIEVESWECVPFGPNTPLAYDALVYVDGIETASLTAAGGSAQHTVSLSTGDRTPGDVMVVDLYGSNGGSALGTLRLEVDSLQSASTSSWSMVKSLYR